MDTFTINIREAEQILLNTENQFLDFKSKRISGKKIQETVVAMANADGGEIFVGIEDPNVKIENSLEHWIGFKNYEEANPLIRTISQDIKPQPLVEFEYYQIDSLKEKGLVLKISIEKSQDVHLTSSHEAFLRKNAQNLSIIGDHLVDLKLSKGVTSYEDQVISGYSSEELKSEPELIKFLKIYSPKTEPLQYLKKQRLVKLDSNENNTIVAGILLYAENPSVIIPKKCAIKISRYETREIEPQREHLKEQSTIEGSINYQIDESVVSIQKIIESMKILRENKLESVKYPIEAIKEILVNAVIHRDYNVSDDILVTIYDNRIEVKSPGRLPGHITKDNILDERFARNAKIVRLLNKYPNAPNKDIGEGLNTAFQKMKEMRLKAPIIDQTDFAVIVTLPHEPLASPEDLVLEYLKDHSEITNTIGRKLSGISSENTMKRVFYRLRDREIIEKVPDKKGGNSAWRLKG